MGHCSNLGLAEHRQDVGRDLLAIDPLRRRALAWQVVFEETLDEIRDRRCRPNILALAHRIAASIDLALETTGFLARLRRVPGTECPDGEAALFTIALTAIHQNESTRAGRSDADGKAFHSVIKDDTVAARGHGETFDLDVSEAHGRWLQKICYGKRQGNSLMSLACQ